MSANVARDDRVAAVTGASGFLGEALVSRLLTRGRVRALFRAPCNWSAALHQRGAEVVVGDLDSARALTALVDGAREVYHCAATMAKTNPRLSHQVNVVGTEHVALAALAAGARRFVYVSSASVYAASRRDDNIFTEVFEPEHVVRLNHYSRTKWEGECVVRRLAQDEGLRFTIIRPTNVYGLRSRPWFRQWESILRHAPVAFGNVPLDLVYVEDVVSALEEAAVSSAAVDEVFNIGHEMVEMSRFMQEVGRVIGRRARRLPRAVDRGVCLTIDRGFRAFTGTQMSPSPVRPAYYPHDKAALAFGYRPRYSLTQGMAEIARLYRRPAL